MERFFPLILSSRLFSGILPEELSRLLSCLGAKAVRFDKKYTVFAEGGRARQFGIVLSGAVQTETLDYDGKRTIVSRAEAGEVFGEAFACAALEALPVSVVASEDCEVLLLCAEHILSTCPNSCAFHRRLIFNLMRSLADKNIALHQRGEILSRRTTREKLLTYLAGEARRAEASEFEIPFDRQALADYLEVDRSGLCAEISRLRAQGLLESRKRRFSLFFPV